MDSTIIAANITKTIAYWYGINCMVLFRSMGTPLKETQDIFEIFKIINDDMKMMATEDFPPRYNAYRYNRQRCSQMLYIIHFHHNNTRYELEQLSHTKNLGGPVWLVFFQNITYPEEYLKNVNIPFNANFITAEIKAEEILLSHVYRVSMEHSLRKVPFGRWTPILGVLFDEYSQSWRPNDLEGKIFRVSGIESWPLATLMSNNTIDGYFGIAWKILQQRLNFSTVYIKPKDLATGVWNGREWNGLIGMVVRGEIDAAISDITMTSGRLTVVDFLQPLFTTRYHIYFQPVGLMIQWDMILRPFKSEVWLTLILWLGMITIMLACGFRIGLRRGIEDPTYKTEYEGVRCLFFIISAFSQQASSVIPKSASCRFTLATAYFFSLIIVIIYSCTLTSMITVQKRYQPFDSLESFLEDGTYTFKQIPGSDGYAYFSNSTEPVLQKIYETLFSKVSEELPKSHKEALEHICRNQSVAHLGEYGLTETFAGELAEKDQCLIVSIHSPLRLLHLTMAVTKDNPYKEALDNELRQMAITGVLNRLRRNALPPPSRPLRATFQPVAVEQIAQVIGLLVCGVVASSFALSVEFLAKILRSRR